MNLLIDILPISLAIVFLFGSHLCRPFSAINEDYLSLETTKYYRGLFALIIVFHHLSKITTTGHIFRFFALIGSLAVSVFFFFSGYGLQKSYIKKGESYRKGFLLKRIPGILIPYIVFIFIYWAAYTVSGTAYTFKDVLKTLVNGHPIVTYSWFIICIIIFYVFFWLFMMICGKHYKGMVICGCLWYILWALFCIKIHYDAYWYRSCHLLIVGILWATYEEKITRFIAKYYYIIAPVVVLCFVTLFKFQGKIISLLPAGYASKILPLFITTAFVCCVILFSMKVKIGNRILGLLGGISLELYLVHGLIIKIIQQTAIQNEFVFCAAVIVLSVFLAFIFHLVFSFVLKKYNSMLLHFGSKTM